MRTFENTPDWARAVSLGLGLLVAWACARETSETEILYCEGSCRCDLETATCSCMGGTLCAVGGTESDVTLVCEGNASCEMSCGERCRAECPGTSGCAVAMGPNSSGVCNGSGTCRFTCEGDCTVDCPGASQCLVECVEGTSCELESCGQDVVLCDDGIQACRTSCP